MKKIIVLVMLVVMMGCSLDQEVQQENNDHQEYPHKQLEVEVVVYVDCDGNIITDPKVIAEIEENN